MFKKLIFSTSVLWLSLGIAPAFSHQPVLGIDGPHSRDEPFEIKKPEISKAIYSRLTGEPHIYRISSEQDFNFYVGLTKPKLDDCPTVGKTFSIDVLNENFSVIAELRGKTFQWWPWFEEFGKKWYWVGPELGQNFRHTNVYPSGVYYIRVKNESNMGNYVLAVGDIESFPIGVMARMLTELPKINRIFWKNASCNS